FATVQVDDWYDCGKAETWLDTNRVLLARAAAGAAGPGVVAPCHLAPDVVVADSRLGPDVSVGAGTVIRGCELRDCVIGEHSRLEGCRLAGSLVGDHCVLRGVSGSVN